MFFMNVCKQIFEIWNCRIEWNIDKTQTISFLNDRPYVSCETNNYYIMFIFSIIIFLLFVSLNGKYL